MHLEKICSPISNLSDIQYKFSFPDLVGTVKILVSKKNFSFKNQLFTKSSSENCLLKKFTKLDSDEFLI